MSKTTDLANVNKFIYALSELSNDFTMPSQQQMLLISLYVHGTVNQQDLSDLTGVKRSSNSRNIAKLGLGERAYAMDGPQYVESFEDPMNRRLKLVRLTPKGRALLEEAWGRAFDNNKATAKNHGSVHPPSVQKGMVSL